MKHVTIVCLVVSVCVLSFARLKAGEKIPTEGALAYMNTPEKKVVLVVNSSKEKCQIMFADLATMLPEQGLTFYLIDSNPKLAPEFADPLGSIEGKKEVVQDTERKSIKALGVIIRPTLFLVGDDQVVHSVIVDYHSNSKNEMAGNLHAFLKGEPPPNFMKEMKAKQAKLKLNSLLTRAQKLMFKESFELALKKWDEVLVLDAKNPDAIIGKSYTLIFLGQFEESKSLLGTDPKLLKKKRFQFAFNLAEAKASNAPEAIEICLKSYKFEHFYFQAIREFGSLLNQAGNAQGSLKVTQQSYKVLLKHFRGYK